MIKVEVEILGISASPSAGGAHALLLKEVFGQRRLPIIIGSVEAQAIAIQLESLKPPRPLTHDLLKSIVDHLGGTVNEVVVSELKENTFYAKILIDVSTLVHEIDSRPSDAIALAVRTGAAIYVAEDVMQKASFIPSSDSDESEEIDEELKETSQDASEKKPSIPETKIAALQDKLRIAIEKEDYELAAKLRDEINKIKGIAN